MSNKSKKEMREKFSNIGTGLVLEYIELIHQHFPGVTQLDQFIEELDHFILGFQDHNRKKLDAEYISETRLVSCTSVVLLIGLWSLLVNPDEKLVFALQVLDKNEREKVKLGHMKIKVGSNQSYYHFRADNDIPELQTCKNPQLEYYQLIENIGWIICNRVSAFRLLKSREKALQEKAGAFEGSLDSLITAEHKKYVST